MKRIWSFLLLAFGFTWAIAGIGAALGVDTTKQVPYMAMAALCMFGPAFAAVVQVRLFDKGPWSALGLHPRAIHWPGIIRTVVLGMSIVPLCLLVIWLIGDQLGDVRFGHVAVTGERFAATVAELAEQMGAKTTSGSTELLGSLPGGVILVVILFSALSMAFTFNLPFMLGEELGWRGYLYRATAHWSGGKRIVFTGFFWGLWHAPLIMLGHNYPGYPLLGIPMMIVFCLLLAMLFDWSRTRVRSVWGPCILHGLINGSAGAFALFAWDGHVLFGSPVGVGGFVAIGLLGSVLILVDGRYRRSLTEAGGVAVEG